MAINIGTRVKHGTDVYEVTDLLNSGGFGTAFLAERQSPGMAPIIVVVKVPAFHVLAHPIWSQKFAREARILANINHPNVVKIIAYWEFPDGEKALVQELVTGATELPDYLKANPNSTASLLLQTFYALHAFHSMTSPSAVHRDLSPRNILVSDSGIVKVIDFGLAKEDPRASKTLTLAGDWFGTPGCMSPEQFTDAASVDHRTDLFAVGRSFAAAMQDRHPQFARPEKLPEPWRTIYLRLSEDDPADRPQSAAEAMSEAMLQISAARVSLENFSFHVAEMKDRPGTVGWPELCQMHLLRMGDYNQATVRAMWVLNPDVFNPPFDVNLLFDRIEPSSAIQEFISGNVNFDDADPLGELYVRLYPHLNATRKLLCFTRVCNTAVRLYRYSVMHDVRNVYRIETDPAIRARLMEILNVEDPGLIIEGRGVLPRNP